MAAARVARVLVNLSGMYQVCTLRTPPVQQKLSDRYDNICPYSKTMAGKKKPKQRVMSFGRGGWRPGAGRPPSKRRNKRVLHRQRPRITARTPAHITLRVRPELTSLRTKKRARVIRDAFVAVSRGLSIASRGAGVRCSASATTFTC